jgi:hypothetical protein
VQRQPRVSRLLSGAFGILDLQLTRLKAEGSLPMHKQRIALLVIAGLGIVGTFLTWISMLIQVDVPTSATQSEKQVQETLLQETRSDLEKGGWNCSSSPKGGLLGRSRGAPAAGPGRQEACDQRSGPQDVTSSWARRGGVHLQQEVEPQQTERPPPRLPEGILTAASGT